MDSVLRDCKRKRQFHIKPEHIDREMANILFYVVCLKRFLSMVCRGCKWLRLMNAGHSGTVDSRVFAGTYSAFE